MALKTAESGQIIGFGQLFLANVSTHGLVFPVFQRTDDAWDNQPDLPFRLREDLPLNTPDMATFYTHDVEGYNTYPFHEKFSHAISA